MIENELDKIKSIEIKNTISNIPEQTNGIIFLKSLREKNEIECPKCHKGKLRTDHSPDISHHFYCTNCDFQINVD